MKWLPVKTAAMNLIAAQIADEQKETGEIRFQEKSQFVNIVVAQIVKVKQKHLGLGQEYKEITNDWYRL